MAGGMVEEIRSEPNLTPLLDVVFQLITFFMLCINFTKDNKVDTIIATGDVVITQPDRITHCGRADYYHDEDKFVLTDQPRILDHKNQISGPEITIYRTTQKMEIKGRSNVILGPDSLGSASKDSALPSNDTK